MPAKSKKQRKLMQAAIHNPAVRKRTGISAQDARKVLGQHSGKSGGKKHRKK